MTDLEVKNLFHVFASHTLRSIPVLKNISLNVRSGQSICVVGPSGSGKTTLLNILAGKLVPTSVEIYHNGKKIHTWSQADELIFSHVTYVPQDPFEYLIPQFTGFEYLMFMLDNLDGEYAPIVEKLGISHVMGRKISQMSGGEAQRLLIALALLRKSKILLFDEPTSFLNSEHHETIGKLIQEITSEFSLISVTTTHSELCANSFTEYLELFDGRMRKVGKFYLPDAALDLQVMSSCVIFPSDIIPEHISRVRIKPEGDLIILEVVDR